jgi:hypothetical protein
MVLRHDRFRIPDKWDAPNRAGQPAPWLGFVVRVQSV